MTPSEFARSIRAKHPGSYDDLDDQSLTNAVLKKYPQYSDMVDPATNPETMEFERGPNMPVAMATSGAPSLDIAMAAEAAPGLLKAAPAIAEGIGSKANAIAEGLGDASADFGGTMAKLGSKAKGALSGAWDTVTGNTPRAFGYAQSAGATPEAREMAKDAISYANAAHPEVADLVEGAAQRPIVSPSGAPQLAKGTDIVPYGTEGGAEAATDLPKPNTEAFQEPIRSGILSGPEEMLNLAETQKKAVGQAIENTLAKYDATGTFYNPENFNNQVKSMLERDMNGEVMTTGWQGEVNDAIKKAASSLNDFSQGGPIKWSDAARIKTGLQGDTNYAVAGFNKANEAYKQVASLLKQDIDNQAIEMIGKQGGNVQDYQALRDTYGKLDSLSDSLNVASKRKFANSPIPWWVKMGAGAALSTMGLGAVKGILGR